MKKLLFDFHIHSCLSPCGDNDMTPNNICNMALINGLNMIALTDHNTCNNCEATINVGKTLGLTVIPGMELCTSEEIHVVCLFNNLDTAMGFSNYVSAHSQIIKNKPNIFGNQFIMDEDDKIIGEEKNLLITTSNISINDVPSLVDKFDGLYFPAHIDKSTYSILSVLGTIPNEIDTAVFEVSKNANIGLLKEQFPILNSKLIITNSDAHYLEHIKYYEDCQSLELDELTVDCLFEKFKK